MQRKHKVSLGRQTSGDLAGVVRELSPLFCHFYHGQQGRRYTICLVGVGADVTNQSFHVFTFKHTLLQASQ